MKFRDLRKQYMHMKKAIDAGIASVIDNTSFISGSQVKELEDQLARFIGVKHCITCANGTDALHIPLMYWNIKKGDAVFVPDFTFVATAEVVSLCGATPVFVDVEEKTFNMDPDKLEEAIKAVSKEGLLNLRAIIPVDLFGVPANYSKIKSIAKQHEMLVLEDGAQGFGGQIGKQKACSFGDISATSFFPAKPLGCYGDGGAIFTDNDEAAAIIRSICVHGKGEEKYDNIRIGCNSRLDTLQAAIMLPKLKALEEYELDMIHTVAEKYTSILRDIVICPSIPDDYRSAWAQYTIRVRDNSTRDALQKYLAAQNIPTFVYYPKPLHLQTAYSDVKLYQECSVSQTMSETVLSLPLHPYMEEKETITIAETIKGFLEKGIPSDE